MIIVLIITSLVFLNFLLLFFSCNKTTKKEIKEAKPIQGPTLVANQLKTDHLAPTGS